MHFGSEWLQRRHFVSVCVCVCVCVWNNREVVWLAVVIWQTAATLQEHKKITETQFLNETSGESGGVFLQGNSGVFKVASVYCLLFVAIVVVYLISKWPLGTLNEAL